MHATRALALLKLQTAMPAPKDPAHLTELTTLASKLTAAYGAGKYCKDPADASTCRNLDELSKVLADDRDWDHDLDAWAGWHRVGRGMLKVAAWMVPKGEAMRWSRQRCATPG